MAAKNIPVPGPDNSDSVLDQFEAFIEIVRILRRECPWDSKQTNESIAHLMIEEAYETIEAIHSKDDDEFSKELGDLLLHIVMHAIMAEERNAFNLKDVIVKIRDKMVSRHPHVFGEVSVKNDEEVMINWEQLKKKEGKKSALEGVPKALPALLRAERIQHKASRVGFDWEDKNGVWEKVEEELAELKVELDKGDHVKIRGEFGDFIFALVNAARHEDIVPEEALQFANEKFTKRFEYIEAKAKEMNRDLKEMSLAEMDALWDEAKGKE
ncbi:MAG: nucleoside triphosphate pyrophosphohydrolase [Candidatus Kapaibacterium sp.]